MQPYVGWALLFASVTCFQGYIKWDLFVLGAQSLDTSHKMLLPAKLPQCPTSQLEIPATFLGGSSKIVETVSYCLPCHWGASPRLLGGDPTRHQQTAWSEEGIHPPSDLGWRSRMHDGTQWGEVTNLEALLVRLVKTWVEIQACLRRQTGRLITSQRQIVTTFWGETVSLRLREWGASTVLCEVIWDTSKT
jgi:hypothetical protein